MEITFIGTGSGKTSLKRNHSSILFSKEGYNLLIDSGDGISKALLENNIEYSAINSILFSHFHPDHLDGMPNLLNQMKMRGRKNNLKIFVHQNLIKLLKNFIETSNIYFVRLGYEVLLVPFAENDKIILFDDFEFTARKNSHLLKYNRELGIEESKLLSLSFLFSINGRKIFYSGDVESVLDLYLFNDKKIDYFISESTHISVKELTDVYRNFKPLKLIITHIEDGIEPELIKWYNKLDEKEKEDIIIANDGMKLEL